MGLCEFCHQKLPTHSGVTSTINLDEVEMWNECEAPSPTTARIVCSRQPGHPGDHIACGLQFHEIERWPSLDALAEGEKREEPSDG